MSGLRPSETSINRRSQWGHLRELYCSLPITHVSEDLTHSEGVDPPNLRPGPFTGTKMYSVKRRIPSGYDHLEQTNDPMFFTPSD